MSPTICDGDIVCIRCQPEVEQGEIAAVRIGGEATLKHFHRQGDAVMLLADNAAVCPPMIFTGLQLEELHIERAVGLCRGCEPPAVFQARFIKEASHVFSRKSLPVLTTRHPAACTAVQHLHRGAGGRFHLPDGHFEDVQLIRTPQELDAFRARYSIPPECP